MRQQRSRDPYGLHNATREWFKQVFHEISEKAFGKGHEQVRIWDIVATSRSPEFLIKYIAGRLPDTQALRDIVTTEVRDEGDKARLLQLLPRKET